MGLFFLGQEQLIRKRKAWVFLSIRLRLYVYPGGTVSIFLKLNRIVIFAFPGLRNVMQNETRTAETDRV